MRLVAATIFGQRKRWVVRVLFGTVFNPDFRCLWLDLYTAFSLHGGPLGRSAPASLCWLRPRFVGVAGVRQQGCG